MGREEENQNLWTQKMMKRNKMVKKKRQCIREREGIIWYPRQKSLNATPGFQRKNNNLSLLVIGTPLYGA